MVETPPGVLVDVQEAADDVWRLMEATNVGVATCPSICSAKSEAEAEELGKKQRRLTLSEAFYLLVVERKLPVEKGGRKQEKEYWEWFSQYVECMKKMLETMEEFSDL